MELRGSKYLGIVDGSSGNPKGSGGILGKNCMVCAWAEGNGEKRENQLENEIEHDKVRDGDVIIHKEVSSWMVGALMEAGWFFR